MQHRRIYLNATSLVGFLVASLVACAFVAALLSTARARQDSARPRRTAPSQKDAPPPPAQTQKTPSPTSSPAPTLGTQSSQGQEIDPDEVIKVDTNLVNLQVRVVDRSNHPINDVRREDFHVFEDGVPQTISFFTREEVPVSYGLVVDNSGSMRSQLQKVIDSARTIVESNRPGDETFLVRFISSDKIETLQDFTSNKEALMDALDNMYVEGGQTAVLDAVYLSAERVAQYKKGNALNDRRRRALILVTDGEDRSSYYKERQLFESLREEDVQIYIIGFVNELDKEGGLIHKSPRDKAVSLINRLAEETGGRAFFPNSLAELPEIAQEITRDLRTQYVIGYTPTNAAGQSKPRDGSYRTVRVTVASASSHDKRIAITRPGYTAPRDGGGGKSSMNATAPGNNVLSPARQKP